MKFIFILSSFLFILFSCGDSDKLVEDNPDTELIENFRISGTIKGASNFDIYLEAMSSSGVITVAECKTNSSGEFEMINNIPQFGIYQLKLGKDGTKMIPFPMEPNDNIKLNTSIEKFQTYPVFSGTKWAVGLTKYLSLLTDFSNSVNDIKDSKGKINPKEMMLRYLESKQPMENFSRESINQDPSNPLNVILTSSLTPENGYELWNPENLSTLKKMNSAYSKSFSNSPISNNLNLQVQQIEQGYQQYILTKSGKNIAPEIALKNPEGKLIKLSSFKGKYVLIDFWASWCAPCRKENPNMVRIYNEYKNKDFTILSVSLDDDINAWKEAIKNDKLIWPNHVSELMGWEGSMTNLYGFQSIPYTVLVDKEGKIIATGLFGESLEQKLKELIKK